MGFSSLPNVVYLALTTASLSTLLDASHSIQMTYFNDPNHASFYYSGSEGLYPYPSPTQTFAIDTEGANGQIYGGPADQWSMVRRSGPMVGSPTSLWATASFGERPSDCFIDWCLTREPQNRWPQPPRTRAGSMVIVGRPTTGQRTTDKPNITNRTSRPNPTTPATSARMVPSPAQWRRKRRLRHNPPVLASTGLRNRAFTDRRQSRSTTGGLARAGPPPAHSTW